MFARNSLYVLLGVFTLLGAPLGRAAQEIPLSEIPTSTSSDLRFQVNRMATAGRLVEAIPYLEELVTRFEASRGARFDQELERFYFLISAAFMQSEQYDEAIAILRKYTARFPTTTDAPLMFEWLGDCYRLTDEFALAAETYNRLRSGYTLRGPVLDEILAREAGSLAQLQRWDEAVPLLRQLMGQARDPGLRGQAATLLVRAYLALDQVEEIVRLLPQLLSVTQSRYDVDFNIMLIQGGDTKFHEGDFASALLLYQLALTKEELLGWHEEQTAELEAALRNPAVALDVKASMSLRTRLRELRESEADILRRDSFTEELLFRKGQTYFEMGRKWEAFWTFWSIWRTLPQSALTRQALFSAFALAGELNMEERAIQFGTSFVDSFGVGDFFDEVTLQLANLRLRRREFDEALAMSELARTMNPAHAYEDRLVFISGYSLFQQANFGEALAAFQKIRDDFPDSAAEEGAHYWSGMAHLFRQDYEAARDEFSEFGARYIGGVYYEDARFRLGVSEYGLGEFVSAREHFERFIEHFPFSVLRAEAHSFLGDIAGAEGRLNDALAEYRVVPSHTKRMVQIDYATFQIGKILEVQEDFATMAEHFGAYLQTYRLEGQYTEALHRIGFARKMMGDVDGMLATYENAIRRYAHQADALGIDLILQDWISAYRTTRGEFPLEWLQRELALAEEKRSEVTALRMRWALHDVCGSGQPPAFTAYHLRSAPPAVLEWIGRATAESRPDFARSALEKVEEEYPESPWAEAALRTWGELEASAGNTARALELFERQFAAYPTSAGAALALKRSADMKAALRQFDEAIAGYLRVLEVREWRGPLWPESLYRIGSTLLAQGKLQEAFGYFQRVYILYEGYPEWAARAYLQSGVVLERLNRRREAIATYREMLANETYRGLDAGAEAERRLSALQ